MRVTHRECTCSKLPHLLICHQVLQVVSLLVLCIYNGHSCIATCSEVADDSESQHSLEASGLGPASRTLSPNEVSNHGSLFTRPLLPVNLGHQ